MAIPVASLKAEIGVDGEVASSAALTRFGGKVEETSTKSSAALGRIGVAARATDEQLSHFGVPFSGTAGRVITSFEGIEKRGTSLGSTLSNLGRAEATAAAVGLAAVATEGVHLADSLELSRARLETATTDAGQNFDVLSGHVAATDKNMEKLGFTNADTESSLARLEQRTHSLAEAQRLEQVAADTAAGTHKDLATATALVVQVDAGRYTQLSRLGIATKDQIKGFKDSTDAVNFLANAEKGQAAAATDTFAGKMKVLGAEATDLGATIGLAVVPKLESAAQAGITGVHSFENFNDATHGLTGKVLALGAAVPVAFFAIDKLSAAGTAVGASFDRLRGSATSTSSSVTAVASKSDAAAVSQAKLTVATERSAAANAEYDAAMAEYIGSTDGGVAASQRLVVANEAATKALEDQVVAAEQASIAQAQLAGRDAATAGESLTLAGSFGAASQAGGVVLLAYLALNAANSALKPKLESSSAAVDKLTQSFAQLGTTGNSRALLEQYGAGFQDLAKDVETASKADSGFLADKGGGIGEFIERGVRDLTGWRDGWQRATQSINDTSKAITNLNATDPQAALASFEALKANLIANGATAKQVDAAYKDLENTLHALPGPVDAATQAQTNLTAAQGKYATDIIRHAPGAVLAADYDKVRVASGVVADAQTKVAAATEAGSAAIEGGAAAATSGAYAYLGLADSVKTVTGALAGSISAATSAASSPYQLQLDTSAAQASADDLHGKLDTPIGGGSTKTATAAAIDQKEKELALRDALLGVKTAETGVTQAQHGLTSARAQATDANRALGIAERDYRDTLNGVAASSHIALVAQQALTQAQRDAQTQALAVEDAQKNLALAHSDSRLAAFGVTDAQTTLTASQGAAATANATVKATEAQLAQMRTDGASSADDIAAAEQAVVTARTAAAPLNEQAVKDQVALDDARINAKDPTENVRKAELDLQNQRVTLWQKTRDVDNAQRNYNDTLKGFPKNSNEARKATKDLSDAQITAKGAADGVVTATQAIITAQNQIPSSVVNVEKAQADLDGKLTTAAGGSGGMGKLESRAGNLIGKLDDLRQKTISVAQDMAANITAATGSYGQGVQAFVESLRQAVANEPLLAGAFDTVIAKLQADYQKWLLHQPLTPITGHGGIGATPNSPTAHTGAGTGDGSAFNIPGHAGGGFAPPGSTFTVGEDHFEIAHARVGGGVDILSNPQSRHALSGGGDVGAKLDRLIALLSSQRPGVHVDTIIARDAEDTMRKIDQQQKRQYLLANI